MEDRTNAWYKNKLEEKHIAVARVAYRLLVSRQFLSQILAGKTHMPDYVKEYLDTLVGEKESEDVK